MPDRRAGRKRKANIDVITIYGTYQHLAPSALDLMLENHLVKMFKRSSGWVKVGIDPIRVKDRREASQSFKGPERRSVY